MKLLIGKTLFSMAILAVPGALAQAQAYPAKPIRMVLAFAPGGASDLTGRLMAPKMSESLGQPVIVENRPGAGGIMGATQVARAAPDGYTFLLTTPASHVMVLYVQKSVPYDPVKDFTPITAVVEPITAIALHASLSINNVQELVDYVRRNPGKLTYGTSGVGTAFHTGGETLKSLGIEMVHVPFKGSGPSVQALIAGQISMVFSAISTVQPHVRAGKVKMVALLRMKPHRAFPSLPALADVVPGFIYAPAWFGTFGPAGLPAPVLARLHDAIVKTIHEPGVTAKLEQEGLYIIGDTPQQFAASLKEQIELFGRIAKMIGLKPE